MKKILIPTDFSDCANVATEVALAIAKKAEAELYFLHIHKAAVEGGHAHMHGGASAHSTKSCANEGKAKAELDKLVHEAEHLGLKARQILALDHGHEEIEAYAQSLEIDFIVMGSHGASGLREMFIGSNAQRVVRDSSAPVLVVKNKPKSMEFKNIVFASSFEEDVHKPFLEIIEFADLMEAKIHLLYVNMPFQFKETDEAEENMRSFLKKCPRGTCSINIYNALNEEIGIQKFAELIKADVVALTTHGRAGFMKMISHSITESLVNHSSVPVLSVNIKTK